MLAASEQGDGAPPKRIVFYGVGEVAEIGYICLAQTDLELVGVVDEGRIKAFFGVSVSPPDQLDGLALGRQPFDRLVVMSFGHSDELRPRISSRRVPLDRVVWL